MTENSFVPSYYTTKKMTYGKVDSASEVNSFYYKQTLQPLICSVHRGHRNVHVVEEFGRMHLPSSRALCYCVHNVLAFVLLLYREYRRNEYSRYRMHRNFIYNVFKSR